MKTIEVFFCYARVDKELRDTLAMHLGALRRSGQINVWHDYEIQSGAEWMSEIDIHLNTADIVLLLVSPYFISSNYCWGIEMRKALERHESGEARVIPIILRPVDWEGTPISKLQALPKNGQPITLWQNRDQAYLDVAKGLREVIKELQREKEVPSEEEKLVESGNASSEKDILVTSHQESKMPLVDESQYHDYLSVVNLLYILGLRKELLGTWDQEKFAQIFHEKRTQWSQESAGITSKALAAKRCLQLIPLVVRLTATPSQRQILTAFARSLEHS